MMTVDALPTPAILVDRRRLEHNIREMQAVCDAHGVELRPHVKTHKLVPIARLQLAAGARGLTCAKLGEAEAMLPSGVRSIFVAHSLVDPRLAPRIAALIEQLDDFRVGLTSEAHVESLTQLARAVGHKLPVMLAVDTGLGREGARDRAGAQRLAAQAAHTGRLELRGLYTHEGHFYGRPLADHAGDVLALLEQLDTLRDSIDPSLALWPGCSVTAPTITAQTDGRVQAVRPGAYVFGDLALSDVTGVMSRDAIALHVLATVIDKPEPGLALIDAGSKTFSSDRTPDSVFARTADRRDLAVVRVNEEHGYVRGRDADALTIGERLAFIPAHVCTVINLTDRVFVTEDERIAATWPVEARGRSQ